MSYLAVGYYYCIIWVLVHNNVLRGLLMSFILVLSYTKYIPHISYSCVTSVRLMVHYGQDYYYYFPPLRFTF